jgi:hypothetical protein
LSVLGPETSVDFRGVTQGGWNFRTIALGLPPARQCSARLENAFITTENCNDLSYQARIGRNGACVFGVISRHGAERATLVRGGPGCLKVIFEDQYFRVIDSVRKKGVHDKLHSHPVPSIVYHVTDCTSLVYGPDGKPTPSPTNSKAGTAFAVPIISAHSAENVGPADCHQIFVERK